jgi:hypothetical protein
LYPFFILPPFLGECSANFLATILTAGYLEIIRADPTFVASIFTGCLANYGISRASNKPEAKEPTVKTEPASK